MLLVLIAFSNSSVADEREGSASVPVQLANVVEMKMSPHTWLPGTVIGRYDSKIAAEVEGRLEMVLDVGDRVAKGEKLAIIEALSTSLRVDEMRAGILPKQARLEFLKREVERLKKLESQNNAAKNRLDEVSAERKQMDGELKMARAKLAQVQDQLSRTIIAAPFDGVVMQRYKSPGERVEINDTVVRLVNTSELEIQVRVPPQVVSNLEAGHEFEIKDGSQSKFAKLRTYVPVGDSVSRLYELRLGLTTSNWMAGHAVRVAVPIAETRRVIAVPRDALVIRQKNVSVFKITPQNIAEYVAVETGVSSGMMIEVKGNLVSGDRVVIRGNERLRPGLSVSVKDSTGDS